MNDRAKFDGDSLLAVAIRSGQASAAQVHQHAAAGELPITMLEDEHGVVCGDPNARLLHLADIGATVLIEAYARRVPSHFVHAFELRTGITVSSPVYDVATPDDEELPDVKTHEEMASDLQQAAAHLLERGLITRPVANSPQLVTFVARAS